MALRPATRHALQKPPRLPSIIKEQRFLLPPPGAKDVVQFYEINSLLKTANYLMKVEDRMLPVAFFAGPRYSFKTIIGFLRQLRKWKAQGYSHVLMAHGADPIVSIHQPFGRYYVWEHRLKTMRHIEPISK